MQWLSVRCSWNIFEREFKKNILKKKKGITAAKVGNPTMDYEISSKLTKTTREWCQLCCSGVLIVNCIFHTFSNISIVEFKQVNVCCVACMFK